MSNNYVIKIENLVKFYGKFQALYGVNLSVEEGKLFGFLGPNGAGKTTTIRLMLDLIRPTSGSVKVFGISPIDDPIAIQSEVGYLPGELRLYPNLKVAGQIKYFNQLRKNRADWEFVLEIAERINLPMDRTIKNLSKGNKQKIGILQALMHKPKLLLLDEPTSGLDPLVQQEVYKLLREAKDGGATIFFSSHVLSEVEVLADQVAIIRQGKIVEESSPSELKAMSMRRVNVTFKNGVDLDGLGKQEGISILSSNGGNQAYLQVDGEMDTLIKILAQYPIQDFEIEKPSLEEIFIAQYKEN